MIRPVFSVMQSLVRAEATGAPGRLHPLSNLLGWNILHPHSNLLEWRQDVSLPRLRPRRPEYPERPREK